MFDDRAERQGRHKRQRTDKNNDADQQHDKQGPVRGQRPTLTGVYFLAASEPAIARIGIFNK